MKEILALALEWPREHGVKGGNLLHFVARTRARSPWRSEYRSVARIWQASEQLTGVSFPRS